jgi:hypothetical protein
MAANGRKDAAFRGIAHIDHLAAQETTGLLGESTAMGLHFKIEYPGGPLRCHALGMT